MTRPIYRSTLDRRPVAPPALPGPDELDRTAQQVRLDYEGATVHQLAASWSYRAGLVYQTGCGEMLSRAEGAILTTRKAGCFACQAECGMQELVDAILQGVGRG